MEQGRREGNIEKDAFHANFDDAEAMEKFSGNCARIWNLELSKFQKLLSHFADAATLQMRFFLLNPLVNFSNCSCVPFVSDPVIQIRALKFTR